MKKLPIILVYALFLLVGVNAFANNETEKLATKMMNDPKVVQFLKNQIKLTIANSIESQDQPLPDNLLNKINAVKEENITLANTFKIKYPEFLDLSVSEKSEVLNKVLSSTSFDWSCFGTETKTVAGILGVILVGGIAQFRFCMAGVLVADIIGAIVSGGTATPALVAGAVPEISVCATLATGTVTGASGNIVLAYLAALFLCVN